MKIETGESLRVQGQGQVDASTLPNQTLSILDEWLNMHVVCRYHKKPTLFLLIESGRFLSTSCLKLISFWQYSQKLMVLPGEIIEAIRLQVPLSGASRRRCAVPDVSQFVRELARLSFTNHWILFHYVPPHMFPGDL
ncbi:hypothetical protein EVAR_31654_1 [Eumeta japonica]|uniref:Uncharacterized protein n=1 Tax=Eumeta variegata TaxID=151549 RepID=A0A4C1W029_EUMVA|nr:hypothetical protein EVAR_31654_1 [Eumeta japonica]